MVLWFLHHIKSCVLLPGILLNCVVLHSRIWGQPLVSLLTFAHLQFSVTSYHKLKILFMKHWTTPLLFNGSWRSTQHVVERQLKLNGALHCCAEVKVQLRLGSAGSAFHIEVAVWVSKDSLEPRTKDSQISELHKALPVPTLSSKRRFIYGRTPSGCLS